MALRIDDQATDRRIGQTRPSRAPQAGAQPACVRDRWGYSFPREAKDFEAFVDSLAKTNRPHDLEHMRAALLLAERGLGRVWPNPAVGCLIVDAQGHVVGRGISTRRTPHAETEALKGAGAAARGGTAYVTLEPCSHHGKTPLAPMR